MKLWIRSQDKEALVHVNDIKITNAHKIGRGNDELIYLIKETSSATLLGKYTTKERALEVLDNIQKHIDLVYIDNTLFNKVYEMPKE